LNLSGSGREIRKEAIFSPESKLPSEKISNADGVHAAVRDFI